MLKKIWAIFLRDLKVGSRDSLTLIIIIMPILLGIGVNLLTPSINDTTVNLALLEGENPAQAEYFADFAKVELFPNEEAIETRVKKRDHIVGILPDGDRYYIMSQGNEPESVIEMAKLVNMYYAEGINLEDATAKLFEFGETVPPLKKMLTNTLIIMISILGGMLITFNIIEEKTDHTISAMNVTTVSKNAYLLGKSLVGMLYPVFSTIVILLITGFRDVNLGQLILMVIVSSFLSLLIGFIQGINNDDVMSAAASVKMLFLPVGAAIAAIELLNQKWQILFYWIPFYWTYKGNDAVLLNSATWPQILLYSGIVLALGLIVYLYLSPKIRKGLA
ncbi:MAG: ABC transporter substrate-binding protein [Anaerolineaceae bacterium]|nr:ABC transporter substrate-binding protein [Anaerolineaceae bacterium]